MISGFDLHDTKLEKSVFDNNFDEQMSVIACKTHSNVGKMTSKIQKVSALKVSKDDNMR